MGMRTHQIEHKREYKTCVLLFQEGFFIYKFVLTTILTTGRCNYLTDQYINLLRSC